MVSLASSSSAPSSSALHVLSKNYRRLRICDFSEHEIYMCCQPLLFLFRFRIAWYRDSRFFFRFPTAAKCMQRRSDWSEENGGKKSSRHNSHSRWHSLSRLDYWKIHDRSMVTYVNCDFFAIYRFRADDGTERECSNGENLTKFSVTRPSFHTALFIEFQWGNLIIHGLSRPRWSSNEFDDSIFEHHYIMKKFSHSIPSLTSLSFTFMIF